MSAVDEEIVSEWQSTNREAEREAGDDSPEPAPEAPAELRGRLRRLGFFSGAVRPPQGGYPSKEILREGVPKTFEG